MSTYRRILEFIVGVIIATLLISQYSDKSGSRYLIDFIMPYQPFKAILVVVLMIISSRLIAGKPKDYSKRFYELLVWLFGEPSKKR
jgi:hypothetical protein